MLTKILRPLLLAAVLCAIAVPAPSQQPAKRPLTHADYAAWRGIQSPALSPAGSFVAYAVAPQEGDGEFILRHLNTGKEFRHARGNRPATQAATARPGRPAAPTAAAHLFSPDGKFVVFPIYAAKADKTKAKTAVVATSTALGIMETASGKVASVERVRSYQVPEEGAAWLAYLRSGAPAKADTEKTKITPKTPTVPETPTPLLAGELVLRNLADGKERAFPDVTEFSLAKDGRCLVFAVQSKQDKDSGLFAVTPGQDGSPQALRTGEGRYNRITWDEKQTQLVFYHSVTPKAAKQGDTAPRPQTRICHWSRPATGGATQVMPPIVAGSGLAGFTSVFVQATQAPPATELTPKDKAEFLPGYSVSDQGTLSFSADGKTVAFAVVAPPAPKQASTDSPSVELWHFQDEFIQPMQKARYTVSPKTYRAVFHLADRACRQLADESVADVVPFPVGDWALGRDDRAYRRLVGSEEAGNPADLYLVNQKTGAKKLVWKKARSTAATSPGGKYALTFDGSDWHAIATADGKSVNLTQALKVRFDDELHDTAGPASPYGFAGWTKDDKHVLLYDRFDVWMVSPDGADAKNLTDGLGRKTTTALRVVRTEANERAFDQSKPLLLRAENETTRDTGFYRQPFDGPAKLLIMGARSYSKTPAKAAKGDRYLLTVSTFYDFPDLYTADLDFTEVKRVSDANPEKAKYVWGKSELMTYKNSDGVPLQAMLIKPENFDPKKKYPMLVYIYERLSHELHTFKAPQPGTSINPTYYASNGYLVLMPDITYTVGQPGLSSVKCVLPAVQAVVDKGCVNEKAIGIQGHSWGGYQTAYLVTQTTRFAAASAGAPVSNMTSAYGGVRWGTGLPRQFQYEKTQSRIGATPWQARDKYLENSPLFHADRIKTPLLMLHNDQDEAVPWQQGIEYYLALRRLNKEVYLFNYRGEGHGLRQRVNQQDYTVRMQQFFDHHLKGAKKPDWMDKGIPYAPAAPAQGGPTTGRRTRS